jgi:outer membrane protein OmpA-like peptidoglycan-associated protein
MTNRCLLGAGVALAVAFGGAQAHAQLQLWPGPGTPGAFYVGPEGGWTALTNQTDQTNTRTIINPSLGFIGTIPGRQPAANFDSGFNVGGRAGYQWGPWRLEEEYSYRRNSLSGFTGAGAFGFTTAGRFATGQRTSNSIMTNAIYDFTIGWPVSPHIGVGVGAVEVIDSVSLNPATLPGPGIPPTIGPAAGAVPSRLLPTPQTFGGTLLKGSSWQFGYQAIAGLRYDFSPSVSFDLDYRYLATTDPTFNNQGRYPFPNGRVTNCCGGGVYTTGYNTQNVVASVTMKFGAPPPAPPPPLPPAPPPPPPQKVYLVFFDWDKYNITPEGQQIIQLAAQQYRAGGSVRLQVTGYTDLSGSAGYNQRLSERRANAVAKALAALGVARTDMAVIGRGMNDPRVPTAPGVREPQNRRVEILFP